MDTVVTDRHVNTIVTGLTLSSWSRDDGDTAVVDTVVMDWHMNTIVIAGPQSACRQSCRYAIICPGTSFALLLLLPHASQRMT